MKIILAPDSFKGSLTTTEFIGIAKSVITSLLPEAVVEAIPLADGGEGTLDAFHYACPDMLLHQVLVRDAFGEETKARLGVIKDSAIVEVAQCIGLPMAKGRENPLITSSFGVGEMILYAKKLGVKRILLALGGSSTNDLGLGMLSAMGYSFLDKDGKPFIPVGGNLHEVVSIVEPTQDPLRGIELTAMCDVQNPLTGENGAARIYAAQKGASSEDVKLLEHNAQAFLGVFKEKASYSIQKGAGAAGGIGYAVLAFLNGRLLSGVDCVLDLFDYDKKAEASDLVLTGEGSFDKQSLMGKAIGGLIRRSPNMKIVVFSGRKDTAITGIEAYEISKGQTLEFALSHAKENLEKELRCYFAQYIKKQQ